MRGRSSLRSAARIAACLALTGCGGEARPASDAGALDASSAPDAGRPRAPRVRSLAGALGSPGNLDGPRALARFAGPSGTARAEDGSIYVADSSGRTIRRVGPDGTVSTIAGADGIEGIADGIGAHARFMLPTAIVLGPDGALYVSDSYAGTIRRVTLSGAVTTYAGRASEHETVDGPRETARFWAPEGLAFDGEGNLFVADRRACAIRRIGTDGEVTTVAGRAGTCGLDDGPRETATLAEPFGLAIAGDGSIALADGNGHAIRWIDPAGAVTTVAGAADGSSGSEDGTGRGARFSGPRALAFLDDGSLVVADSFNDRLRHVTRAGVVTTLAGGVAGALDGTLATARFSVPSGIEVVVEDGQTVLYVSDVGGDAVRRIAGGRVESYAGLGLDVRHADGPAADARFSFPSDVMERDDGSFVVTDTLNDALRLVRSDGRTETLAGGPGLGGLADGPLAEARFLGPTSVVTDGAGGYYVADAGNHRIRHVDAEGVVTTYAGGDVSREVGAVDGPRLEARFAAATGLARDSAGNLYFADPTLHMIRRVGADGNVTTVAGDAGRPGWVDGEGSRARFQSPSDLVLLDDDTLLVADTLNCVVRRIELGASATVTTLAGTPPGDEGAEPRCGSDDGRGPLASFRQPRSLVREASGTVLVADTNGDLIRRLDPATGLVSTVAGTPGRYGIRDGALPGSLFEPAGLLGTEDGGLVVVWAGGLLRIDDLPER